MPFKLKDTGVTLSYQGQGKTILGEDAEVLKLTFEEVGVTPENLYEVWVSSETDLVIQWAYFKDPQIDTIARFVLPWKDYQSYGNILLSGNRGERALTDIKVLEEVPERIFTDFSVML
jgi:hypothetical protein